MTAAEGGAAERSAAPFYFTENRLTQTYRREGTMVLHRRKRDAECVVHKLEDRRKM